VPVSFIFFVIIFVLAAILTGVWLVMKGSNLRHPEDSTIVGSIAIVLGLVAGIMLFVSSMTIVPANEVGIMTTFGRWSGTVDSGFHMVSPWSKVDTFPTRNQKSIRDQADGNYPCIPVKLNGGASACVDATVLYTIDDKHAETLWRGWGSFTKLNEDLINRSTDDAAGMVYGGYTAEAATSGSNRQAITDGITRLLSSKLNESGVTLNSVTLGDIHLPNEVQGRINSILEADAQVIVAQKQKEKAAAEADAARARQLSLTPEALIKECLDAAREIKPTYFDCGLGGTNGRPSVILQPR
jgi:regulator of protease activity HflC (stomatin/prohibitin superfamily)